MMVALRPDPVVIDDSASIELMWLFIRAGRVSFTEFVDKFGADTVAAFLADLDAAGLRVVRYTD